MAFLSTSEGKQIEWSNESTSLDKQPQRAKASKEIVKLTTNATGETERMRSEIQKGLCRYRLTWNKGLFLDTGLQIDPIQARAQKYKRWWRDLRELWQRDLRWIFGSHSSHPKMSFWISFSHQTCLGYASSLHSRTWKNSSASASHGIFYTGQRCAALLSWSIWLWCWWSLASVQMHSNGERERKKQLNVSRHRNFRSSHWSIVLEAQRRCVVFRCTLPTTNAFALWLWCQGHVVTCTVSIMHDGFSFCNQK